MYDQLETLLDADPNKKKELFQHVFEHLPADWPTPVLNLQAAESLLFPKQGTQEQENLILVPKLSWAEEFLSQLAEEKKNDSIKHPTLIANLLDYQPAELGFFSSKDLDDLLADCNLRARIAIKQKMVEKGWIRADKI